VHQLRIKLKEEHRLSVFQDKVLKRILGHKRKEITEGWRRLFNEELHHIKKMERACSNYGVDEKYIDNFSWKNSKEGIT
jgi:hypothetical protein